MTGRATARGVGLLVGAGLLLASGFCIRTTLDGGAAASDAAPDPAPARSAEAAPVRPVAAAGGSVREQLTPPPSPRDPARPAAPSGVVASLRLSATPVLKVGEIGELRMTLDPRGPIGAAHLVLRFDPGKIQAREGSEAVDPSADPVATTGETTVGDAGDRAEWRLGPLPGAVVAGGGAVAVVRFQALAPGRTVVTVEQVSATDPHGGPIRWTLDTPAPSVLVLSEAL